MEFPPKTNTENVISLEALWIWGILTMLRDGRWPTTHTAALFISLIRMRSKRDIKMGRLCTPGVQSSELSVGGVTFRFLNGEAILDENMLFWVRLYALVVVLKILLDFRL